jgi:copper chaperone CopZ
MVKLFGKRKKGQQIELTVHGMTCGHCEMRVANALKEVTGVLDAEASHERERATVTVSSIEAVDVGALVTAVEAAGYRAEPPGE